MSDFRVERQGGGGVACLLTLALTAALGYSTAWAQGGGGGEETRPEATGAPVLIEPGAGSTQTPPTDSGPPVPPEAALPEASSPGDPGLSNEVFAPQRAGTRTVGPRPGVSEPAVEVGGLEAPGAARLGTLSIAEGGLSPDMWKGTSHATAVALLRGLVSATGSPAMRSLERRALLSQAGAPEGVRGATSLLALRLARLLDMGDLDAVQRLSEGVMMSADYEEEQRMRAEAFLYRGAESEACTLARTMRMIGRDIYWAKLGAFCEHRADDAAAAQLSVQLIQARGVDAPAFFALFERLVGIAPPDAPLPADDGTGMSFAMRRAAGLEPPHASEPSVEPPVLRALALSTGGEARDRLAFAEAAARFGAISAPSLAAIYGLQSFGPAELADPQAAASAMPRALGNALLVAAAGTAEAPARRIELALSAYKRAREQEMGSVMMQILSPLIVGIAPEPSLSWAAADLVKAYLAVPYAEPAYRWYALAISGRERSSAEGDVRDRLAILLRIAAPGDRLAWSRSEARKLVHRAHKRGGESLGRLAFELALLAALGYEVPPDEMAQLPTLQPVAAGAVAEAIARFESAVEGRRLAEAVFGGLIALGPQGPAASQHETVVSVVRGLAALGLEADARAIAREALLGLP